MQLLKLPIGKETRNWISGLASEKIEWLNITETYCTNQQKWFHANEYQQNADTFETYAQSFESNDPQELGSYEISIKDLSGNERE